MKISTEFTDYGNRSINTSEARIRGEIAGRKEQLDRQHIEAVISRITADKNVIDALTTAQLSQDLINRAMEVAARLKNAALQRVTESTDTLEQFQVESNNASELAMQSEALQNLNRDRNPETAEIPAVSAELTALGNTALAAAESGSIDPGQIDRITQSLADRSEDVSRFTRELGLPSADITGFTREQASEVSNIILSAPETALTAQGNLTNDQVNQRL